ncbi:hypothetical protein CQW23_31887 [Capsicum baccatum]|uniref:Uncharacterized protein n=1 Tax=Capsicum baccatum TaxID=33114 RepID=A0A2G2V6A1_CAPBA|nr:hypothetical protein CQW23_31887 [Capsicum baccatum]
MNLLSESCTDMGRHHLGGVILGLLTLGGIDFSRKRLLSKKEEETSTNDLEVKVDYESQLSDVDKAKVDYTITSVLFADCGGFEEIDLQATKLHEFECFFNSIIRFYFSSVPVLEHVKISLRGDALMPFIFGEFAANLPAQVTHFLTEMQIFRNPRMLVLLFESNVDIVKVSPVLDAFPVLQSLQILVFIQCMPHTRSSGQPLLPINPEPQ